MFFVTMDTTFGSQTLVETPTPNLINITQSKIETFGTLGNRAI